MINLNKLSVGQREKIGLKIRPMIEMNTIEDMFCPECRQLLKPIRKDKAFRTKGRRYRTSQLIAWCYECNAEWDVKSWIEVLFRRKIVSGLTVVIEQKAELAIYPTVKYFCKKCDRGTVHTYRSQQTRSADESETTFYRCGICGNVTRESL